MHLLEIKVYMRLRDQLSILNIFIIMLTIGCQATGGLQTVPASASLPAPNIPVRFLLTFDDGPSAAVSENTTEMVLNHLSRNAIEPSVKAIFFVQTRTAKNGGSKTGLSMMQREYAEDHILALHSGTARGHVNHTVMAPDDLQQSLADGMDDIAAVTGKAPLFVRPTYWRYNAQTLARYDHNGLNMMLSDVKAYDGGSGRFHPSSLFSTQRHGTMLSELQRVCKRISNGELPVVDGVIPVVVTFHDTNRFTASPLEEYMRILVEEAAHAGLKVNSKPFYDNRRELENAALKRAEHRVILETRLPARVSRFFKGS
jgi:peptidoglycan/xylan/chitin deacetylase (PgdA/CDA1 family)